MLLDYIEYYFIYGLGKESDFNSKHLKLYIFVLVKKTWNK